VIVDNKKAKKIARVLKASEGISYTSARRATPPPPPDDYDDLFPPDEDIPRRSALSVEVLVKPLLQHKCDDLADEPVDSLGDVEVRGQVTVDEAAVHQLQIDPTTIDVHVIEEFEGGTMLCSLFAEASLTVEGLMRKNDAATAAEKSLVQILEHHSQDYALVAITTPQAIQVEFDATVTPEAESVDDLNFVGATQLAT
jgi:hypothetical protein